MGILDADEEEIVVDKAESSGSDGSKRKTFLYFGGVVLILAVVIGGSFFVIKKKPEILGLTKDVQEQNRKETEKYVAEIGKLMLLPDETPTLATVSDLEKVKGQPFFENAQNGDIVLIYTNAKKAILYRPSEKRIIEVGVVNTTNQQPQVNPDESNVTPTAMPTQEPTVTASPTSTPTLTPTPNPTNTPTETP